MAGGGKETPRQQMVGMMYLVLTALLALQVSNTVLQKFKFIDDALKNSVMITQDNSGHTMKGIEAAVAKANNRAYDVGIMNKAKEVRDKTSKVMTYMDGFYENIIKITGGRDDHGALKGEKDYDMQMAWTLGPEGSKSGEAYKMKDLLNAYATDINKLVDSLDLKPIALDGKDMAMFKNDPDASLKDFAQLNFDHTPTVAALAIIQQLKSTVVAAEAQALEKLAAKLGADQIRFDKIIAVVSAESKIVAAGTKYKAEMFLAASSSSAKPTMSSSAGGVKMEDGKGIVEFTATAGPYDAEGKAKKSWVATIKLPTPVGDTTLTTTVEYFVAKPVIQVQAGSVSALYLNCGNDLNIQVPALGTAYEPSFTADGGQVIPGAKKGAITVVPTAGKVSINVSSSGSLIGTEVFNVKRVPLPTIKLVVNGKPADIKQGYPAPGPRGLKAVAQPEENFASFLPKDARYKITEWHVTLARGKRPVESQKFTDQDANLSGLIQKAKEGDRLVIEVKEVKRMNFKGQVEDVKIGAEIFSIPIN